MCIWSLLFSERDSKYLSVNILINLVNRSLGNGRLGNAHKRLDNSDILSFTTLKKIHSPLPVSPLVGEKPLS